MITSMGVSKKIGCLVHMGPLIDTFCVILAGLCSYKYVYGAGNMHDRYWVGILVFALLLVLFNFYFGGYKSLGKNGFFKKILNVFLSWSLVADLATSIVYFYQESENFSRLWFICMVVIGGTICSAYRILMFIAFKKISRWMPSKKIYIIGNADSISKISKKIKKYSDGYYMVEEVLDISNVKDMSALEKQLEHVSPHEIWLAMPLEMGKKIKETIYSIRNSTAELRFFPDVSDLPIINQRVSEVLGMFSIDLSRTPMAGSAKIFKRMEDIFVSLVAIFLLCPFFAIIAISIKMESKGNVIFKQYRTGVNGRKFKVYKFRSMFVHEEKEGVITQASRNDNRITKVGAFLRKTSLDELPQFFNVLQGRMSVVGPRPHALAHNEYYKDLVESYMQRHKVKPGITGWAQVRGYRGETDTLDKMQKRVQMDIWYICNWSLMLDIKIIFLTVFKGFINRNAF